MQKKKLYNFNIKLASVKVLVHKALCEIELTRKFEFFPAFHLKVYFMMSICEVVPYRHLCYGCNFDAISKLRVWGWFSSRPGFVTAKAALNSDRMKVSCSTVPPRIYSSCQKFGKIADIHFFENVPFQKNYLYLSHFLPDSPQRQI